MITNLSYQTNKHFVLKLISLTTGTYKSASGQLQNSEQLQNNTINSGMSITINSVIKDKIKANVHFGNMFAVKEQKRQN